MNHSETSNPAQHSEVDIYHQLFRQRSEDHVSLAGLYSNIITRGSRPTCLPPVEQTRAAVQNLLGRFVSLDYRSAPGDPNRLANLRTIDEPGYTEDVAVVTATIIDRWERVIAKNRQRSPFEQLPMEDIVSDDFNRQDVMQVLDIAHTVDQILGAPGQSRAKKKAVERLIVHHGADFAVKWFSGELVAAEFGGRTLNMSRLTDVALKNPADPLGRAKKIFDNLDVLDATVVSEHLGVPIAHIAQLFTPSMLLWCAQLSDPLERIQQSYVAYKTELTTEKLAGSLGADRKEIDALFSPARLIGMAITQPLGYMQKIAAVHHALTTTLTYDNIAAARGVPASSIQEAVPTWVLKFCSYYADPLAKMNEILQIAEGGHQLTRLPMRLLVHLATKNGNKFTEVARLRSATREETRRYRMIKINIRNAVRLDEADRLGDDGHRIAGTNILSPEEILYGDEDDDQLLARLVHAAQIDQHQFGLLMDHFTQPAGTPAQPAVDAMIRRLREAARAENMG